MVTPNHTSKVASQKVKPEFDQTGVSYLPISENKVGRERRQITLGMRLVKFRLWETLQDK